ncbi:hypothetical protein PSPO01_11903 [Paraphaeosphaeria sporulosa]
MGVHMRRRCAEPPPYYASPEIAWHGKPCRAAGGRLDAVLGQAPCGMSASIHDNAVVPDDLVTTSLSRYVELANKPLSCWSQFGNRVCIIVHATMRVVLGRRSIPQRLDCSSPTVPGQPWPLAGAPLYRCSRHGSCPLKQAGLARLSVVRGAANHSEGKIGGGDNLRSIVSS